MPNVNAFEIIDGKYDTGIVLLGDHAMAHVPENYGDLGLDAGVFHRHIAYDIGIEKLTRALSARLQCPAVMSTFSRLLIDPNRGEDDPTLIMKISDGQIIPANHPLSPQERKKRIEYFHRPYHNAIDETIARVVKATGKPPVVFSLHSFTPVWKNQVRPWHAGVLWDGDPRAVRPLISALSECDGLVVGENEPYTGALKGDTMNRHCMMRGIAHALLEVRQDLLADDQGIEHWAGLIEPIFATLNADETLHEVRYFPSRV